MKFYFCEGCGKRITEHDIEKGEGRDKKLKGVYCRACAHGISTMNALPLTDEDAKVLLASQPAKSESKSSPSKPRRQSNSTIRPPGSPRKTSGGRPVRNSDRHLPAESSNMKNPVVLGAIGLMVLVGMAALFIPASAPDKRGGQSSRTRKVDATPAMKTERTKKVARKPIQSHRDSPAVQSGLVKKSSPPNDSERLPQLDLAKAEFEKLMQKDGMDSISLAIQIAEAKEFLDVHPETKWAAEVKNKLALLLKAADLKGNQHTTTDDDQVAKDAKQVSAPSQQPLTPSYKTAFQTDLELVLAALEKDDLEGAEEASVGMAKKDGYAAWQKAAVLLPAAINFLKQRKASHQAALEKQVNRDVTFFTKKKIKLKGQVLSLKDGIYEIQLKYVINGKPKLGKIEHVALTDLASHTLKRIDPPKEPDSEDGWAALVMLDLAAENMVEAEQHLSHLKDDPRSEPLKHGLALRVLAVKRASGLVAWEELLALSERKPLERKDGQKLREMLLAFSAAHGDTELAKAKTKEGAIKKLMAIAERAIVGFLITRIMNGKVEAFDPETRAITIFYDFNQAKQLDDWESLFRQYTDTGFTLDGHAGSLKNGQVVDGKFRRKKKGGNFANTRAMYVGDIEFTYEVEGSFGGYGGGMLVYHHSSRENMRWGSVRVGSVRKKPEKILQSRLVFFPGGPEKLAPFPSKINKQSGTRHTLTVKGTQLSYAVNGSTVIENYDPKNKKGHPRFPAKRKEQRPTLGFDGWGTVDACAVTFVRIKGTLQKEWLEQQAKKHRQAVLDKSASE